MLFNGWIGVTQCVPVGCHVLAYVLDFPNFVFKGFRIGNKRDCLFFSFEKGGGGGGRVDTQNSKEMHSVSC